MKQSVYEIKAALYERIYEEISTIANARICEYNDLRESMKVDKFFEKKHHMTSDDICFHGDITWEWDDYWSYGGHEHGQESIPHSWIYDDNWKVEIEKTFQAKLDSNKKKASIAKRKRAANERKQYKLLKEKYGD